MTTTNEFDRVLAEWLDEGPRRAPDRPIDLAVEHARSHPRRPDPLGFLRADPMAPRRTGPGLRPVLVLAALTLALVAALAIGGGAFRNAVQPPVASPSPTASSSASPTPARFAFELSVPAGQTQTITVIDGSGRLTDAASGAPDGETGTTYPFDSVDVTNLDPTTIQLAWSGYPCATDHTLLIDAGGRSMTLTRPRCQGDTDTIAIDRIVVLVFAEPLDAADVEVALTE